MAQDTAEEFLEDTEIAHDVPEKLPKGAKTAHNVSEKSLEGGEIRCGSFRLLRREERCIRIVANFWTLMVLKTEFFQVLSPTFIANSNNHNFCAFIKPATWNPTFP